MNTTPNGEPRPTEAWLARLRERLLAVASRRVPAEAVEDVVQDALRVIVERKVPETGAMIDDLPGLAWCFQVLRNTIGNYYQKARTRRTWRERESTRAPEPAAPTPLDALESADATRTILAAIQAMRGDADSCGRYLECLAQGTSPADLARSEGVEPAVLYRRIYRCRHKLRVVLIERGILA
jgi:DNA-directed RNA polymerase specialized sigma24 family protein